MISAFFPSCKNDLAKVAELSLQKEVIPETAKNVELLYTTNGKIQVRLTSPVLEFYQIKENPYTEFPYGLNVLFYAEDEESESALSAGYGISYEAQEKMIVRDSVVVVNKKGETLYTDELTWDEKKQIIHTDKFVKIVTQDEIIFGEGMEAKEDFSEYTIRKIRGTVAIETEE